MRLGVFFEIFVHKTTKKQKNATRKDGVSRFTNYDLQHKEYPAGDEQRADEYAQGNFLV